MNHRLSKAEIFNIVSIVKALAIVMVVFFHEGMGAGNQLYQNINHFLTPLRMPVFMFASGFLYFYVTKDRYPKYSTFVLEKAKRLLIPLVIIKICHLIIRFIKTPILLLFMPGTELPPFNIGDFVTNMLFFPHNSQFGYHLWFVYTLFLIFLVVHLFSTKIYWLTALSLVLFFVPMTYFMGLNYIRMYLVFFCLGAVLQQNLHLDTLTVSPWVMRSGLIIGLIVLSLLNNVGNMSDTTCDIYTFIKFLSGIVVVICTSTLLNFHNSQIIRQLRFIGNYSASIYFLHMYLYQIFAVVVYRYYIGCSDLVLCFLVLSGLVVGVYTPILVDKYLISRSQIASLLILGRRLNITVPQLRLSIAHRTFKIYHHIKIYHQTKG